MMRPRTIAAILGVLIVLGTAFYIVNSLKTKRDSALDQALNEAPSAQNSETQVTPEALASPAEAAPSPEGTIQTPVSGDKPSSVTLTPDANGLSQSTAVIQTSQGVIKFKFYSNDAPNTIKRFVELIQSGFYKDMVFHRVVDKFVIQTGDPTGLGSGGSGQKLKAEFNSRKHVEGTVAMARAADIDSADSQFYISLGNYPHLDRQYTIIGQVTEGMDVARKIRQGDKLVLIRLE